MGDLFPFLHKKVNEKVILHIVCFLVSASAGTEFFTSCGRKTYGATFGTDQYSYADLALDFYQTHSLFHDRLLNNLKNSMKMNQNSNLPELGLKVAKITFISMSLILIYLLATYFIFSKDKTEAIIESRMLENIVAITIPLIYSFIGFAVLSNAVLFITLIITCIFQNNSRKKGLKSAFCMLLNIPVAMVYAFIILLIIGPLE